MAEKLYKPDELELVPVLRDGESWIMGAELLNRSAQLGAVEGKEQAEHLWKNRNLFQEEWKAYYLVIPERGSRVLNVFYWDRIFRLWCRYRRNPGSYFYDYDRLLRPRE